MIEDYYSVLVQQNMLSFIFAVFLLVAITMGLVAVFQTRKSKQYRKEIMDIYVASKTKYLADKEGLDIVKEYESFKKWLRKQKLETSVKDLDDFIEDDLKGKLFDKVIPEKAKK